MGYSRAYYDIEYFCMGCGHYTHSIVGTFCHSTAVLLENFSIFYNEDDTELSHGVVKDFKQNWLYFDKKATVSY